jgi:hypothetical protein
VGLFKLEIDRVFTNSCDINMRRRGKSKTRMKSQPNMRVGLPLREGNLPMEIHLELPP